MDLNYSYPANVFLNSEDEENNRLEITIIPNVPTKDRVNDIILLKAYDDECINEFLKSGYLDYDHQSVLGKTPLERAQARIGDPTNFFIDEKKKVPVIEGFLYKGNPYVDNILYPALKAKSNRISASVGGRALRKSITKDPITKEELNAISKLSLKHCAVTYLDKAIHPEASVTLKKSCSGDGKCKSTHHKCKDCNKSYELKFNSYDNFLKSLNDGFVLKALTAGTATDISGLSGGQVLQRQSLEGTPVNLIKIKKLIPSILSDLFTVMNVTEAKDYIIYLKHKGFNDAEAIRMVSLLAQNKSKIIKLF